MSSDIPDYARKLWIEAGYTDEDIRLMGRINFPNESRPNARRKRGRQSKWAKELNLRLIREVGELANGGAMYGEDRKVSNACKILATCEPWRSLIKTTSPRRKPWQALRERYVRLFMGAIEVYNVSDSESDDLPDSLIRRKARKRGRT